MDGDDPWNEVSIPSSPATLEPGSKSPSLCDGEKPWTEIDRSSSNPHSECQNILVDMRREMKELRLERDQLKKDLETLTATNDVTTRTSKARSAISKIISQLDEGETFDKEFCDQYFTDGTTNKKEIKLLKKSSAELISVMKTRTKEDWDTLFEDWAKTLVPETESEGGDKPTVRDWITELRTLTLIYKNKVELFPSEDLELFKKPRKVFLGEPAFRRSEWDMVWRLRQGKCDEIHTPLKKFLKATLTALTQTTNLHDYADWRDAKRECVETLQPRISLVPAVLGLWQGEGAMKYTDPV